MMRTNNNKRQRLYIRLFLMVFLLISSVRVCYANVASMNHSGFLIAVYAGLNQSMEKNNGLALPAGETDTLFALNGVNSIIPGVGIAYLFWLASQNKAHNFLRSLSLGLNFFYLYDIRKGDVFLFGIPTANPFTYISHLNTARLMFDGQLSFHPILGKLIPFLDAAIGVASITNQYNDIPKPGVVVGGRINLPAVTRYNFVYSLGGGVKMPLSLHLLLTISYLYTHFGNVKTSIFSTSGVVLVRPINIHLYTHTELIGLTYFFR